MDYRASIDGILFCRHFPGFISMGDVVGVPEQVGVAEA